MNERMITIPYEEYKELQTFRDIANSDADRIFVKNETDSIGHHYSWWTVYTKDDYVKNILEELNKYKEKEQESVSLDESGQDFPYKRMFWMLVALMFLYAVVRIIEPIFK